jgi:type IV pilus assembly protein PilF
MPASFRLLPQQWVARCWQAIGGAGLVLLMGCAGPAVQPSDRQLAQPVSPNMQQLAHTRLQLAAMHWEDGRTRVALDEISQALHANPHSIDAFNLQGWIHLGLHHYADAHASFSQALSLQPGNPDTMYNLGWLACQQKRYAAAHGFLDAALASPQFSGQSQARMWLAKGVCWRDAGDWAAALQAIEKASEIDAGDPVVAYNFADILYTQGASIRARALARQLNEGPWVSAASLWLGIRIERKLGERTALQQLADQLHKRFPGSKEWQRFERGAFDD